MTRPDPVTSYLVKDYASFRALLLDHLECARPGAASLPVASIEITLAEAMAYVGDYLSYYQDAVATEAYPQTARLRGSLARHARLTGRPLVEGCCARVLLRFEAGPDPIRVPAGTRALTRVPGWAGLHVPDDFDVAAGVSFATLHDLELRPELDRIEMAPGANPRAGDCSALLDGPNSGLSPGDFVLLECGDGGWSQPLRLESIQPQHGATRVGWHPGDALRDDIPAAGHWCLRANLALAEEGYDLAAPGPAWRDGPDGAWHLDLPAPAHAVPFCAGPASAAALLAPHAEAAEPALSLDERLPGVPPGSWPLNRWHACRDRIAAPPGARLFTCEAGPTSGLVLDFGAGADGPVPDPGIELHARCRVSHGAEGNVAAGTVAHLFGADRRITAVGNPLPASGGCDPESLAAARARLLAGPAVGTRCVTLADYEARARSFPGLGHCRASAEAAGRLRRIVLEVARADGGPPDSRLIAALAGWLAPDQLLGDVVRIVAAARVGEAP